MRSFCRKIIYNEVFSQIKQLHGNEDAQRHF